MEHELRAGEEFYFQWHLTERCNLACAHCYQQGHPAPELSLPELLSIVAIMEKALTAWQKVGTLSLTGGEPFLRRNDLFALMRRLDSSPVLGYYDVLTNGSLIGRGDLDSLASCQKLRRVQLSLEGATVGSNDAIRGHGSFESTLNALRLLRQEGVETSIMVTLSRHNAAEIDQIVELASQEGVSTLAFERLIPEGRGTFMASQLLSSEELKRTFSAIHALAMAYPPVRILLYRPLFACLAPEDPTVGALCSAGNNALTLMPDGTLYPCRRLPLPLGNVLKDGLFSVWYSSEILWKLRNPRNLTGKCQSCSFLAKCRGCRAMAFFATGDFLSEDPQCWC